MFEYIAKFIYFDVDLRGQFKVDEFFKANVWKSDSKADHERF